MFSTALSVTLTGLEGHIVNIEVDVSNGLPYFEMVGYLSAEVKEARERVRTAIRNAGFWLEPKKIIVNLSPADIRKSGTTYDLAIAAAVLCAYGCISQKSLEETIVVGELGLNGSIRNVNGVLPIVLMAQKHGFKRCIVPVDNAFEGAVVSDIEVYGVHTLKQMIDFLNGRCQLSPNESAWQEVSGLRGNTNEPDFADIHGQQVLKRSLEVAAAGMHNILLIGPPGAGKSMAVKRLPTILPKMTYEECIDVSELYSVAGLLNPKEGLISERPFRCPHHTISDAAFAGGGRVPMPGEISLAHRGVLFLDELTEFHQQTMEILRQPLEDGKIMINRATASCEYPADFMLAASINPCRCGYYPDVRRCHCTPLQIQRYLGRISQPLLDRIDVTVEVRPIRSVTLYEEQPEEKSEIIRQRVEQARMIQKERYEGTTYLYNSQLSAKDIAKYCPLGEHEKNMMKTVYEQLELSTRSYHKVVKVARTIADLAGESVITEKHLEEAVFYKSIDRKFWGIDYGGQ